ncbi:MAG: CRTAC1 family protein [Brevirhabdus sp.]
MKRLSLVLTLALAAASQGMADPTFTDRSDALPLAHVYDGGWEHFVGGGVAVFDCNRDNRPEIFAAGGSNPARLFLNVSGTGALSFASAPFPALIGVTGAYPLDIDSDGWLDLVVLRVGENRLLRGGPDCHFTPAPAAWGFDGGARWSTAFSATWEPGRQWPTLAIGNYVDRADPDGPFEACDDNVLFRPEGRRFGPPALLSPGFCALSMLFTDWNDRGRADLRVSNDRHYYVRNGEEQMWRLDPLRLLTEADGWRRIRVWGMGIAARDLTGDGRAEVVLTSMGDQLMLIAEDGGWRNAPYDIGTYAQRPYFGDDGRPSTGWHAEFGDVNNDGRDDLFIAKGNVDQMPSNAMDDPNNLLIQGDDGRFVEHGRSAGVGTVERSRGAALADLNGDGRLDLIVVNRRAPMELYQNATANTGNWVAIEPRLEGNNTRAVGAWIELETPTRTQRREITVGGGHAGGSAVAQHFGLGDHDSARLRLTWPDGTRSGWVTVDAGKSWRVSPGNGGRFLSIQALP